MHRHIRATWQTLRCRCHIFVFVASNCCWRRNLQMIRIVYFQSRDGKISICVLSGRWIHEMKWLHVYGDWLVIFGWCRILCGHVGLHVDIRYFLCRSLLVSVDWFHFAFCLFYHHFGFGWEHAYVSGFHATFFDTKCGFSFWNWKQIFTHVWTPH